MSKYIIRLDDACEKRNIENWNKIEDLLDKYSIRPLVGIIPHCEDPMMDEYESDGCFWQRVDSWLDKGWTIAMHGYNHVYSSACGGLNPVNRRSEFAGVSLAEQKEKIKKGIHIFNEHGIHPKVFFAPSHTFDINTIEALKTVGNIHIISDTVANKPYSEYGMTFVPQQSGKVRRLPFDTITFCYHPNTMNEENFSELERFIVAYRKRFIDFPICETTRRRMLIDKIYRWLYFIRRR